MSESLIENVDGECTCDEVAWEISSDGFTGCPYCEMWFEIFEDDEEV